jgi:dihydrofolate reductase
MDQADRLEITLVDANPMQILFPSIDPKIWQKTDEECFEKDEKNEYSFCFRPSRG